MWQLGANISVNKLNLIRIKKPSKSVLSYFLWSKLITVITWRPANQKG